MKVMHASPSPRPSPWKGEGEKATARFCRLKGEGGKTGFTLIEVLVALVLMGIVLPVTMRGLSLAMAASSNARHTRQATSLAQVKLHELTTESLTATSESGDFAPDYPDYRWTCQITSLDYGLEQLDLRVTWIDRGVERGVTFSTLFDADASLGSSSTTGGS